MTCFESLRLVAVLVVSVVLGVARLDLLLDCVLSTMVVPLVLQQWRLVCLVPPISHCDVQLDLVLYLVRYLPFLVVHLCMLCVALLLLLLYAEQSHLLKPTERMAQSASSQQTPP